MTLFDPARYGPHLESLLRRAPLNPLDAGQPDSNARAQLQALSDESFRLGAVRDRNMAAACRAALWLRFNYLDESHKISQDVESSEGSFWHGILHRREGDFGNAKYWFRRVGMHPVFERLHQSAARLGADAKDSRIQLLVKNKEWDPFAFVDLCEAAVQGQTKLAPVCQEVQRCEWEELFDYCWRGVGE
jgi:hypothetical protein